MSFTVTQKGGYQETWHIGNKRKPDIDPQDVVSLWADGDENELIKQRFVNVPYCHAYTMWRGDMAQFIFENLTM